MGSSVQPCVTRAGCRADNHSAARISNRRTLEWARRSDRSATQFELFDQRLVARLVLALEVVKEAAALGNQGEQATAGMIILLVALEVLGQVLDTLRKDRDLDFRRTGITRGRGEFSHKFLLAFSGNRHRAFPYRWRKRDASSRDVVQQRPVQSFGGASEPVKLGAHISDFDASG